MGWFFVGAAVFFVFFYLLANKKSIDKQIKDNIEKKHIKKAECGDDSGDSGDGGGG